MQRTPKHSLDCACQACIKEAVREVKLKLSVEGRKMENLKRVRVVANSSYDADAVIVEELSFPHDGIVQVLTVRLVHKVVAEKLIKENEWSELR